MSGGEPDDWRSTIGVTNQRVSGLEDAVKALSSGQDQLARDFSLQLSKVSTELASEIKSVATSLQERSKVPWQALGVMLTFVALIGGMAYMPISENQKRMEALLLKLDEAKIGKAEFQSVISNAAQRRDDAQRAGEERDRETRAQVEKIRGEIVSRGEHAEKWQGIQQRFSDQQRQLDRIQADLSGIYTPRDAFSTLTRRMDDVERALRDKRG